MNKSLHSVTEYMELSKKTALDERSKYLRKLIISSLKGGERGHLGSSMSLVEILRVIYDDFLRFDVNKPDWSERDQCILSKGHGCLTLYALLADKGFIEKDMLKDFCKYDSSLGGHPEFGKVPGVEASTGALGHGLSIGVGKAIIINYSLMVLLVKFLTSNHSGKNGKHLVLLLKKLMAMTWVKYRENSQHYHLNQISHQSLFVIRLKVKVFHLPSMKQPGITNHELMMKWSKKCKKLLRNIHEKSLFE